MSSSMRSLYFVEADRVEWREVASPSLQGDLEALVTPVAASRCNWDLEIVRGESPLVGPFAIGHEAVARVVDVADGVHDVAPGDLVLVPPSISCGHCDRCVRGLTAH